MSLKQPFPPVAMPMVDAQGIPTLGWVQFFQSLFNRTNGAAGPAAPLTGQEAADISAVQAQLATVSANATNALNAAFAANDLALDAEMLTVLGDPPELRNEDQTVFLAQLIAD